MLWIVAAFGLWLAYKFVRMSIDAGTEHSATFTEAKTLTITAERTSWQQIPNLDAKSKLRSWGHKCAYCAVELSDRNTEYDHVMPLALGGANDGANIVPSCKHCNRSKGIEHPSKWLDGRSTHRKVTWSLATSDDLKRLNYAQRRKLRKRLERHYVWLSHQTRTVRKRHNGRYKYQPMITAKAKRERTEVRRMLKVIAAIG